MLVAAFLIGAWFPAEAFVPVTEPATLERAESEFRQGLEARDSLAQARRHFRAAFDGYEALRRKSVDNPLLYRDQGNAAFLADDLPEAILAFRRALRREPGDRALLESLEYARDQVQYAPSSACRPPADGWPSWLPWPSDNLLLGLALGLYSLGCVALTRWRMVRRPALLVLGTVCTLMASILGFSWGARQLHAEQERQHPLVVVRENAPLRTGNGTTYPPHKGLPSVSRGMEAHLRFLRGAWLLVEFPAGEMGWLPRDRVRIDTP